MKRQHPDSIKAQPRIVDPISLLWPRSMTVEIAARYVSFTPWRVEELCRSGEIVAWKEGKRWTIDRLELDRYISRRHADAATRGDREKTDT